MYKKRIKSAFELLSNPSAILFEIDIDALQIWLLKDLSSFFVNTEYILTAKLLSTFSNPERNDFIFGVSNRKKSSGLKFSDEDGYAFAHLFALALYTYENGLPETIKNIKSELKTSEEKKPKLVLPAMAKEIKG